MKRGFKQTLALFLAVLMAFGAAPFCAIGMVAFAADPVLVSLSISDDSLTLEEGTSEQLGVIGIYSDNTPKVLKSGVRWSSADDTYVSVSSNGLVTAKKVTTNPVMIYANYSEGGAPLEASCAVTVTKAPVKVNLIEWTWTNKSGAGVGKVMDDPTRIYSFAYADKMYRIVPDNADNKEATLTCSPADALQIDNVNKTFKINKLPANTHELDVTLTLTADGASAQCKPATKTIKIMDDVPVASVSWAFVNGTRDPVFSYYDKVNGAVTNTLAVYYYMPTDMGDPNAQYKFVAKDSRGNALTAQDLELCEVTVSSADKRVIQFDETTGRTIPVGNGIAEITVTVTTPKGKVFRDTVKAHVQNSPYTPITSLVLTIDKSKLSDPDCEYDAENNKVKLDYTQELQPIVKLNDGAKLDNKTTEARLDDGRNLKTSKAIEYEWESSDKNVATVDETGKMSLTGPGDTTITLTVNDNGKRFEGELKVHCYMSWWSALLGLLIRFLTFRWTQIPRYAKAFGEGIIIIVAGKCAI